MRIVLDIELFLPVNFFLFGGLCFVFLFSGDQEMDVSQNLEAQRKIERE